jgi:peptidoglycan/LPS O-acetylase OafA/YrhL
LLQLWAGRWRSLLIGGAIMSIPAAVGIAIQLDGGAWANSHAVPLRWGTSLAISVTMTSSVLGWTGFFVRFFQRPSARIRYVADASYWIYLVHLPVVVALQIAVAQWKLPWWIQLPLINLTAFTLLVLSYHYLVRFTWIGAWLNGRRAHRHSAITPQTIAQTQA